MGSALIFVPNGSTGGSGNSPLAYAPDIYVSPANGNDNNSGTSEAEALRTFAELIRRVGKFYAPQVSQTVHLLDDCNENIPAWQVNVEYGLSWRILGQFNVITSGTITNVRNLSSATNTLTGVEGTGLVPGAEVGRLFRNLNTGAISGVIKDEGGGVARLASMLAVPMSGPITLSGSQVNNNIGDEFETLELTRVTGSWNISVNVFMLSGVVANLSSYVAFCALEFAAPCLFGGIGPLLFLNCRGSVHPFLWGDYLGTMNCINDASSSSGILRHLALRIVGGATIGMGPSNIGQLWSSLNYISYVSYHVYQGCLLRATGAELSATQLAITDAPTISGVSGALFLDRVSRVSAGILMGDGNAGYGVQLTRGASLVLNSTNNGLLTGTLGDIRMGLSTTACAFDVATQTYTAPRTLSWANLNASVASGGFGRAINDPATGCVLAFETQSIP